MIIMSHQYIEDIDKAYVSEYDTFLLAFDNDHPIKSASQQAEIKKHKLLAEKRDNPLFASDDGSLA